MTENAKINGERGLLEREWDKKREREREVRQRDI